MLNLHCVTAIDRLQLFPFGAPQGDDRLDVGDDVSSPEVQLRTPVVFYDDFYSSLYVSANGRRSDEHYTPEIVTIDTPIISLSDFQKLHIIMSRSLARSMDG